MNWLNLKTSQLREPKFIGSEPVARATWLCVMAYCVELENGGRITGARLWKDRQWQQTCGVMLSEIQASSNLLSWDGDDLIVWNYPTEKEFEIQQMRELGRAKTPRKTEAARLNGSKGGRPPTAENPTKNPTGKTKDNPTETQRKEGERKGKEGEVEPTTPPAPEKSDAELFADAWNELPPPFPKVRAMSSDRMTSLRARLREEFWDQNWRNALARLRVSDFCRGKNDRAWVADVDFFLRPGSVAKIMEGKYDMARAATPVLSADYLETEWPEWLRENGHKPVDYQFAADFLKSDFHKERKARA